VFGVRKLAAARPKRAIVRTTEPTGIPPQFSPIPEFIARHAEYYPEKTAVIFDRQQLTWGSLNQRANRIANHLLNIGFSRGDKAAILSPNCLEYPEMILGILKAGGTVVPLSTLVKRESILRQLRDAGPKVIFANYDYIPQIEDLTTVIPGANHTILLSGKAEGFTGYEDFLYEGSPAEPGINIVPEDVYNIIYSSGTTGAPKGIVHTHQARILFAMTCGLEFRVHNEAIGLISTPMYSNGTQLIFLPVILAGGTVVLMRSFDPLDFLDLLQSKKCTHAFLVPTQFIRIMEHPQFSRFDTSSMELLLSAAAPLRMKTKEAILLNFPNSKLAELYGITEGISTVLRPNEQSAKPGSVGKPRLGGDIKILNYAGEELPREQIGEIAGCNISMMTGYYGDPVKTLEVVWRDRNGKLYLKTGDIGKLDEDGYLYILDRKKDMIISGGMNIFPGDIEEILLTHPEVAEAAVIAIPHREWGETPIALVVKKGAKSELTNEELRQWANSRLAGHQKLAAVEFRESLPRNDLEKILKTELRRPYWTHNE
jgi:long-chain acyl-CoA synthetase